MITLSTAPMSVHGLELCCEASDFGPVLDRMPLALNVESHKTGRVIEFVQQAHRDAEGDTTHWTFRPLIRGIDAALASMTLTIFND